MDDFVQELDEDVEGMQSTIYFLQQQLKDAKETITTLEAKRAGNNDDSIDQDPDEADEDSPSKKMKMDLEEPGLTIEKSDVEIAD